MIASSLFLTIEGWNLKSVGVVDSERVTCRVKSIVTVRYQSRAVRSREQRTVTFQFLGFRHQQSAKRVHVTGFSSLGSRYLDEYVTITFILQNKLLLLVLLSLSPNAHPSVRPSVIHTHS